MLSVTLDTFYVIYALIEQDLTKAAYIAVKRDREVWFLTRTAHVTNKYSRKKWDYVVQALVCGMEGDTMCVPYNMQKTNVHSIGIKNHQ
jgi:hypothetical protein